MGHEERNFGIMTTEAIELRHLRYFVAAVEHGSFRKASVALRVQESAISRRIRDLESHLGVAVFKRCSWGVQLTSAGELFCRERSARFVMFRREPEMPPSSRTGEKDGSELAFSPQSPPAFCANFWMLSQKRIRGFMSN